MVRFFRAGFISTCLLLSTSGCSSAPPLVLPDDNHVSRIEAWKNNTFDVKTMRDSVRREITGSGKVSEVMEFLRKRNHHMETPFGTFPTPSHTIVIHDDKGDDVVIFIGLDWLGGRNSGKDAAGQNRLTALSRTEKTSLLNLLGLPE